MQSKDDKDDPGMKYGGDAKYMHLVPIMFTDGLHDQQHTARSSGSSKERQQQQARCTKSGNDKVDIKKNRKPLIANVPLMFQDQDTAGAKVPSMCKDEDTAVASPKTSKVLETPKCKKSL